MFTPMAMAAGLAGRAVLIHQIEARWFHVFTSIFLRYAAFSCGVWLFFALLKQRMQSRKIQAKDVAAAQIRTEILVSIRSVFVFSVIYAALEAAEKAGYVPGPQIAARWGPFWFAASLLLIILVHDAYFYWVHRLIHHRRLFRKCHMRHHRSRNPTPFTAYSFDIAEAVLMAAFVPLWMVLVPTPWTVIGIFMLHQIARNVIGHAGYEISPARRDGRPLIDWMTTATHHDLHHQKVTCNYGLYFTWWDRWMGTEHRDYHRCFATNAGVTRQRAEPI